MTHGEAKQIYDEAAGIIRAILYLKELLKNRDKSDVRDEMIRRKVEDVKKWQSFMEQLKEKQYCP